MWYLNSDQGSKAKTWLLLDQVFTEKHWLSLVRLCVEIAFAERDSDEICYLYSPCASAVAVWTCGSFSWCWSCPPESLIEGASWVEEANKLITWPVVAAGWAISRIDVMGRTSAWGMAWQRSLEYQWRVHMVMHCSSVCSHTWLAFDPTWLPDYMINYVIAIKLFFLRVLDHICNVLHQSVKRFLRRFSLKGFLMIQYGCHTTWLITSLLTYSAMHGKYAWCRLNG